MLDTTSKLNKRENIGDRELIKKGAQNPWSFAKNGDNTIESLLKHDGCLQTLKDAKDTDAPKLWHTQR